MGELREMVSTVSVDVMGRVEKGNQFIGGYAGFINYEIDCVFRTVQASFSLQLSMPAAYDQDQYASDSTVDEVKDFTLASHKTK